MMLDTIFESWRKAQESSLQSHQELLNFWTQPMAGSRSGHANGATDWGQSIQRRFTDLTLEMLAKHRQAIDALYGAGIELVGQTLRVWEARSPESLRQRTEDLWRKMLDVSRQQSETQFRQAQQWTERSFAGAATAQNGT